MQILKCGERCKRMNEDRLYLQQKLQLHRLPCQQNEVQNRYQQRLGAEEQEEENHAFS